MRDIVVFLLQVTGLAMVLAAVGSVLVWNERLKTQRVGRYTLLATTLTAMTGLWRLQSAPFAGDFVDLDVVFIVFMIGIGTYALIQICIRRVRRSQAGETDMQDSSMLSMLYVGSRQDAPEFAETVIAPRDAKGSVTTPAAPLR